MKHSKIIGVIAAVVLLTCLAVLPVSAAAPPLPCAFSGSVTLDGAACVGSIITVQLTDGTPVTTSPATVTVSAGSTYNVVIAQDENTGLPAEGDTLKFYVDGNLATTTGDTATWEAGGLKTVNLAATTGGVTYYTLTIEVSPAGSGTTDPAAGTHSYAAGTSVPLTATAASGYDFSHWSGDASGTSSTTTVIMNADKSVTANFVEEGAPPQTFAWWLYETLIEPFM